MCREPSGVSMSDTLGRTRRLDSGRQEMEMGCGLGQCKTLGTVQNSCSSNPHLTKDTEVKQMPK